MKHLAKEALAVICERQHVDVSIRGKGVLRLAEMTAERAIEWERKQKDVSNIERMHLLLAECVVDSESMQPMFEAAAIAKWSSRVVLELFNKAVDVNGFSVAAVEIFKGE